MKKKIILSTAGVLVLVAAGYYVLTGSTSSDDKALARIKVTKGNIVDKALAVIEYARNVLNIKEADHAESNPDASVKIVAPLSCSLVGVKGNIVFKAGSKNSHDLQCRIFYRGVSL